MFEKLPSEKEPMPASTLLLIQDKDGKLQVYLLKRRGSSGFFPGNYVFPGGIVDSEDRDTDFWKARVDLEPEEIDRRLGGELGWEDALAFAVAAIRETFEEAGVLLAWDGDFAPLDLQKVCACRRGADLRKGWMHEWFEAKPWTLSLSMLGRWAHWITPKLMKRRFDTRFFVAFMPRSQACVPDQREMTEGLWISPGEGLAENLQGTIPLSPPTVVTMHELLKYRSVESLQRDFETFTWGAERRPRLVPSKHGSLILEPWDPLCDKDADIDTEGLEEYVLPPLEPFSRLWNHEGIWKPVRIR
jgi:8-oxo-dGTP pyrophosphatase MutT (NUDIX family)